MNVKPRPNLDGQRFGRLVVINEIQGHKRKQMVACRCDCGNTKAVRASSLLRGDTRSCGCLSREILVARSTKHAMTETPEYRAWVAMNNRCRNARQKGYHRYGGRGIKVCSRWVHSFDNFYADMGPRPSQKHSIDRIDNNGDYAPENCRWATATEQGNNRESNHNISWNGETRTIVTWARTRGIKASTISKRISCGHSPQDAIAMDTCNRRKGMGHGMAKLTDDNVRSIRSLYAAGVSAAELARRFGIGHSQAWAVAVRKSWKHIP
jgi:hypothetical protein